MNDQPNQPANQLPAQSSPDQSQSNQQPQPSGQPSKANMKMIPSLRKSLEIGRQNYLKTMKAYEDLRKRIETHHQKWLSEASEE